MRLRLAFAFSVALTLYGGSAARAQLACTTQSTAALLPQFSDNAPNGSITPQNFRNLICSSQQTLSPGSAGQVLTLTTSPFTFTAAQAGIFIATNGQVTFTRGGSGMLVSLTGGPSVRMLQGDVVVVTWFGLGAANIPSAEFYPDGQ